MPTPASDTARNVLYRVSDGIASSKSSYWNDLHIFGIGEELNEEVKNLLADHQSSKPS